MACVAGSMLKSADEVRCSAPKKMPSRVQRTTDGSSSNAGLMLSIDPPAEGQTAMASFKNEYSFVIAEVNAIFEPSGDQIGPASVPFCVTRARTLPAATRTTEMSAVPPLALVGLTR